MSGEQQQPEMPVLAPIDVRLRSRVHPDHLAQLAGRVLGPADYDLLCTGPVRLRKPDGRPLAVYLPGVLAGLVADPETYRVLHALRAQTTDNRGLASGTQRLPSGGRTRARLVPSAVVGAVDPMGVHKYCRLTAWTGRNLPAWQQLHPLLRAVAAQLAQHVPDRYAAQAAQAAAADPAWVVPGTPFSTVTVNNTYPTGTHTDKGDLEAGFSTISCLRRGRPYTGGQLVFPEWRVAVDLHDGDLLLMDAHDWHGNVPIVCMCGTRLNGPCARCGAERISVVAYYRERISRCGSPEDEAQRAAAAADRRSRTAVHG